MEEYKKNSPLENLQESEEAGGGGRQAGGGGGGGGVLCSTSPFSVSDRILEHSFVQNSASSR